MIEDAKIINNFNLLLTHKKHLNFYFYYAIEKHKYFRN